MIARRDAETFTEAVGSRRSSLSYFSLSMLGLFSFIILLLLASVFMYLSDHGLGVDGFFAILKSPDIQSGIRLSFASSMISLLLVTLFSVPTGYALSRYRFPGHAILNTVIDVPLLLPPVVIGLILLAFFGSNPLGVLIKQALRKYDISLVSMLGIVMCQVLVSAPYCIRAVKASFDGVDRNLENVALTLGCSHWGAFRRVSLPLAFSGLVAGCVMAWARAIGVFGPLMVFVGTSQRVQVMPTAIWVELNTGEIERAFAISIMMLAMSGVALISVHWLAPGRKWI